MFVFIPTVSFRNTMTRVRVELKAEFPLDKNKFDFLKIGKEETSSKDVCRMVNLLLNEKDKEENATNQVLFCALIAINLEFVKAYSSEAMERLERVTKLKVKENINRIDKSCFLRIVRREIDDVVGF